MNRFLIILLSALLINACGPGGEDKKPRRTPPRGQDRPSGQDIPDVPGNPPPQDKPGTPFVATPKFEKFKSDFNKEYAGYVSLSPEQLFQIIEAVPAQTTTWGCGKVQSNMAKASASVALGLAVNKEDVQDCNEIGDYRLLVDVKFKPDGMSFVLPLLNALAKRLGRVVPLEKINGDNYFRVGALPKELAGFINKRIPKGMRAKSLEYPSLDRAKLMKLIKDSIAIKMPLITLNTTTSGTLHYYSVIGYSNNGNDLLVLNTIDSDKGSRIESYETNDFLERMNVDDYKAFISSIASSIISVKDSIAAPGSKIPDESTLDELGTFNVVTFEKQ